MRLALSNLDCALRRNAVSRPMVQSPDVKSYTKEYDAMIRLAVLSFWHVHAKDYSKQAVEHPDTEIVAIWDDQPERGRAAAQQWGGQFEASLPALLARDDIDGVIV